MQTFVRFTGKRPGSMWYQAPGTQRYAFGQNPSHYQQAIPNNEWPALKAQFGAWLLEIPADKARRVMVLDALVASCDLPILTTGIKVALIDAGLETIGMVLAEDKDRLLSILGAQASAIVQTIGERVGLFDPEPATSAVEAPEPVDDMNLPLFANKEPVAVPIARSDSVAATPGPPSRQLRRKKK